MAFEELSNSYHFKVIDFGDFAFKPLDLWATQGQVPDKILSISQSSVCIRNNGQLLFGSLRLQPQTPAALTPATYNLNIHKFLLLNHYNFEFFTAETAFYLLKTDRRYLLFQILAEVNRKINATARKNSAARGGSLSSHSNNFEPPELLQESAGSFTLDRESFAVDRESAAGTAPANYATVSFNPHLLEKWVNLEQKEFLAENQLESEGHFVTQLSELKSKATESNCSPTLLRTIRESVLVLEELENQKANLDTPARFVFISRWESRFLKEPRRNTHLAPADNKLDDLLTSEVLFNAGVSDQQDFLLAYLNGGRIPESWEELSEVGAAYWFENLASLKEILDKHWASDYRDAKDPWRVLFWLILLGKVKVLSGLFKMAPDSHKFVNFFMEDFSTASAQTKAVNNAYLLRSKKRFMDSAAFFLLARKYREAMELLVYSLQNLQLVVLVFRIFENEIRQDAESLAFFEEIIREKFLENQAHISDGFLRVLGYLVLKNYKAIAEEIANFKSSDLVMKDVEGFQGSFGFLPTAFPLSLDALKIFMSKTGRFKAYFSELMPTKQEDGAKENDFWDTAPKPQKTENWKNDLFLLDEEEEEAAPVVQAPKQTAPISSDREITRMRFLSGNQRHFLALLEMVSLKSRSPKGFEELCRENRHFLQHSILEISFKKLSKLIKRNVHGKMDSVKREVWDLAGYFGVDPLKVFHKLIERTGLLADDTLSLAVLACGNNPAEIGFFVDRLLTHTVKKCFGIIKKGQFILLDAAYWLKRVYYVTEVVATLRLLSVLPPDSVGPNTLATISWFNEILNALVKLIVIRSMCFDETLEMLEIKGDLPIMCANFATVVDSVATKLKKMYPFTVKRVAEEEEGRPSIIAPRREGRMSVIKARVADALTDEHPESTKRVRDLFLQMNQREVTARINSVVSILGLADFISPSNLCLQLLFEMLYLIGLFFAPDNVKGGNIKKIDYCFGAIFFESLKNFILLVSEHELEEALQLLSELQTVLESSNTFLARGAFLHINPPVALNMSFNKRFVVSEACYKKMSKFLEDFKVFLVMLGSLDALSEQQRRLRVSQFGKGIQIFRPKVDTASIFQSSLYRGLVSSSSATSQDIYVLLQQKVKKVALFTSLFKGKRFDEYFSLAHPVT